MLYQLSYISFLNSVSQITHDSNSWSGRRESNPRPTAWKAVTLPLSYSRSIPAQRTFTRSRSRHPAPAYIPTLDSSRLRPLNASISLAPVSLFRAALRSCTKVRTAKKAKISKAAKRIFLVQRQPFQHAQHAVNRQVPPTASFRVSHITGRRCRQRTNRWRAECWCTGVDSNHRTPQGRTDLQSVGFNRSPTCARPDSTVERRRDANKGLRTKTPKLSKIRFEHIRRPKHHSGDSACKHATVTGAQDISRRPRRRIHRRVRSGVDCIIANGRALSASTRPRARPKKFPPRQSAGTLANARVPGKQLGAGEGI